jgi:membrane fusion protein, multidrug efflux system
MIQIRALSTRQFRRALVVACLISILTAAGCKEQAGDRDAGEQLTKVRVEQPKVAQVIDYDYFTGRTAAPYSLDVRAKVNGYLVRWNFEDKSDKQPTKDFNFIVGQEVNRDQVLFKIDPRPYQAVYDQAIAQINLAKAQLTLAKADYARALNVAKTPGAISQQDVDKYYAAQGKAEAEVAAQVANAESARLNLEYTDVKSDILGIVGRNLLSVGNLVEANTLLTTVVSQDPMYAYFDIDEMTLEDVANMMRSGKLPMVRNGKPTAADKYPVDLGLTDGDDYPFTAYVDFVNNQIDPTTGTLEVRATIDNPMPPKGPRMFVPGMFLRVRLPIGNAHPALVVPQAAIQTDQTQKYVFVVNSDNIVEKRVVKAGAEQPGGMQVVIPEKIVHEKEGNRLANDGEQGEDSLTASDRVIIGGLQFIRPGMKVEIRQPEDNAKN